jgi:F-type H+-transporting ATPase subunit epsilon
MSDSFFRLQVITPAEIFEREITNIRLRDETGFFGIMKGHIDFLTILLPSLGYYRSSNGREIFLAVNGGILSIRGGIARLISREVFESEEVEMLSKIIENSFLKRGKTEVAFLEMLKGIEKAFIESTIEFERKR